MNDKIKETPADNRYQTWTYQALKAVYEQGVKDGLETKISELAPRDQANYKRGFEEGEKSKL